jgi:hypothetical protein
VLLRGRNARISASEKIGSFGQFGEAGLGRPGEEQRILVGRWHERIGFLHYRGLRCAKGVGRAQHLAFFGLENRDKEFNFS